MRAKTQDISTKATSSEQTNRLAKAEQNQRDFYDIIKSNDWKTSYKLLPDSLKNLKSLIEEQRPDELDGERIRFIKTNIRAGEYFDLLHSADFKWLRTYHQKVFGLVGQIEQQMAGGDFDDAARMLDWLHLAVNHVLFEFRYPGENPDGCYQLLERIVKIAQKIELKAGATEKSGASSNLDKKSAASFWSRLFYLRYMVATRRQERRQADQFLRLAGHYLTLQASLDGERENDILQLKNTKIAIAECWLEISNGQYRFARQLLDLVRPSLKNTDPFSEFEYALAESVCLRCLESSSATSLRRADDKIKAAIEKLRLTFSDLKMFNRLFWRGFYERALCLLLLVGMEDDEKSRARLFGDLDTIIRNLNTNSLRQDPSWKAQIEILESRVAMYRHADLSEAEKHAGKALRLISDAPSLKLLQIEARIALAVTLLRQEKYSEAVELLNKSLALNEETKLLAETSEFNQPALRAVSYLYLARIYVRQKNNVAALENLEKFRRTKDKVEHDWVLSRLAPEIEREVSLQCLAGVDDNDDANLDVQLLWLRKAAIEKASQSLQTSRVSQIAEKLKVTPQTLNGWLRDLQENNFEVGLFEKKKQRLSDNELENQKQAIENAMSILGSKNKAEVARFLRISRPTFYKRLEQLKKAGLEIYFD